MMLSVDVQKQLGDFRVDAQFETAARVTALFGASGAGKTSIVNMIAGLIAPDRGRIELDGETLFDSERGIDVPAHRRGIGYVFQEARLFPHLSVRHNLDYGRWMRGLPRERSEFARVVELLGIGHLLERRPGALSGGERQRVAIGRALLARPRLLLLDEPLASLDRARQIEIMSYLVRLRDEANVPMIYVGHRQDELRHIAARVIHVEAGRVRARGGTDILDRTAEQAFG